MYLPRLTLGTSPLRAPVWLAIAAFALITALPVASAGAQEPSRASAQSSYSEDEVKAAFLFHFATYAEWPPDDRDPVISFAVLRETSIAAALERFVRDRNIQGRRVRVRQIRSLTALNGDEVLFIGSSQNRRLPQLIRAVKGPTLVVTDAPDGLPEGAMINFQLVDHRVRFEIALPAAQRVGLTLSSRLLSAAIRVEMSRCNLECRVRHDPAGRYATLPVKKPSRA
jgi:hypothetical protein